ncbi:uncharacterized protein LOC127009427 [Eriocheir sinensis]|uniref:uncharacterized protein LOC127009427 n=1 Tax=Eriocheir sinensis TaxID=95602 RepID=UPI0021C886BD|nr:uncharacterized protein LOC127009427 [Eriocheir sinensis]
MLLEVVVAVLVVVLSVKVYTIVTAGRCTSTRSMAGKTVIITGATAGIGKETARDLLRRGARVIIACRNMEKSTRVAGELRDDVGSVGEVVVRHLDTSDLTSVRTFAKEVLDTEKAIHVLVNNAGMYSPGERKVTANALELTMATNHFGHFLLTNLLLGRLKESVQSRIINVSSEAYKWPGEKDMKDLAMNITYSPFHAYSVSKLCNVLFTRELADRMAGTGVTVNSLHPGFVKTDIITTKFSLFLFTIYIGTFFAAKDVVTGAQTTIHLAVSEEVEGVTGRYFADCKETATTELARRKDLATALWEASVKAVGLQQHETRSQNSRWLMMLLPRPHSLPPNHIFPLDVVNQRPLLPRPAMHTSDLLVWLPQDLVCACYLTYKDSGSSNNKNNNHKRASPGSMLLEVVVAVLVVVLSVKVYTIVTAGRCTSTRSMAGKTVIITGATAGIGKETARDLLRRGARVIIACRNMEKGARVAGELRADVGSVGEVVVRHLDTSNLASVRTFAKEVLDTEKAIHVLMNNAGILGPNKRQVTTEGLELTMATNHFGHFLLTNLLLGRLKESAPSRIVNVSSTCHYWPAEKDLKDLAMNVKYTSLHAYSVSKLCNVIFTRELADRMAGTGVTVNSLDPGFVKTDIMPFGYNLFILVSLFLRTFAAKETDTGAQTNIHLAVSEELEGVTGRYFSDCKEKPAHKLVSRKDLAAALWEASVKAVGLQQHEAHYIRESFDSTWCPQAQLLCISWCYQRRGPSAFLPAEEGVAPLLFSSLPTGASAGSMLLEVVVAVLVVVLSVKVYTTVKAGRCTSTRSMEGKTVIITGATAGIGKETARDLLRRGARIIIACRNMEKGARVAGELRADVGSVGEVVVRHLDTSVLASVRTFAKEVLDTEKAIHVLINNAGILGPDKRQVTAEGLELTMATNHFGHFLLTNLLLGRLKESAPSRIVNVSSSGHFWPAEKDLNDLAMNIKYSMMHAYSVSKLCNVIFTRELADRMAGTGVTVNSLNPGFVTTDIVPSGYSLFALSIYFCRTFAAKDAATGAQTNIHLAVSEELEGVTGRYFDNCKEKPANKLVDRKDLAAALWEASVKAVGLQQHETYC